MPPRVIRPKDESNSNDTPDRSSVKQSGRRRAVPSACIPCRRRKSKCDGGLPACSTCVAVYRTDCSYDADVDGRPRSTASRDVQSLQQRNDALDVIVASLRALPENEAINLLQSLRASPNIDAVAASARSASSTPTTRPTGDLSFSRVDDFTSPFAPSSVPSESPPVPPPPSSSNSQRADGFRSRNASLQLLQDPDLVHHLLDIYFAWAHPFNRLFAEDLFLSDMRSESTSHFSTLLLYAILAFACHYTDKLEGLGEQSSAAALSDYCYQQAEALLASVDKPHITTVQALGIMGIREASRGRDSIAYQLVGRCLRMAIELNLHVAKATSGLSSQEIEARQVTLWGIYTLEALCSTHAGRTPQLPLNIIDLPKLSPSEGEDTQEWQAHGHEVVGSVPQGQAMNSALFANCLASLCELSSMVLETLYSPTQTFTSRSLSLAYDKYLNWYANLPKSFWLESTSPPHVTVLHIFFNMCIIGLFKPYMKLDLRAAALYPRETCTRSASEISRMVSMLRDTYGLRRVPMITVHALIAASSVHVLNLPAQEAESNLRQAMEDFATLSTNHQCSINGINLVQSLASRWSVRLPKEVIPASSPATAARTAAINIPPTQSNESYGVLYDNIGSTDDMPRASWAATSLQSSQPFIGPSMMAMSHPNMTDGWSQHDSQQNHGSGMMDGMSWQWQPH